MSRSTLYRPIALSAEELAEIARRNRVNRLHNEVMPALRAHLSASATRLASSGQIPQARANSLIAATGSLDTVERLDALVANSPELQQETHAFEITRLSAELASLRDLATTHLLPMPRVAEAEQRLAVAQATLAQTGSAGIADELRCVGDALADIDAEMTVALGEAECQRRAMDAVTRALSSMGYDVTADATPGNDVIRATSRGGRVAEITIADTEDGMECVSTFRDNGHALPEDHEAAKELCDPAVEDQLAFQKLMQADAGLAFGKPHADGRPVRGTEAAASPRPARRWQRAAAPLRRRAR